MVYPYSFCNTFGRHGAWDSESHKPMSTYAYMVLCDSASVCRSPRKTQQTRERLARYPLPSGSLLLTCEKFATGTIAGIRDSLKSVCQKTRPARVVFWRRSNKKWVGPDWNITACGQICMQKYVLGRLHQQVKCAHLHQLYFHLRIFQKLKNRVVCQHLHIFYIIFKYS